MIYWRPGILRCPRLRTPIEPSATEQAAAADSAVARADASMTQADWVASESTAGDQGAQVA